MRPMRTFDIAQILVWRFPWRGGNRFTLHEDGVAFFPRMLQAIARAQHSVELEMYLVASGHVFSAFRDALIAAAARGVRVRVLLDHFGSLGMNPADRSLLLQHDVRLLFYNRLRWRQGMGNLLRNHRKLLLIDGRYAFTGGAGLTDDFAPTDVHQPAWHDVMVEIEGPVAQDWQRLFDAGWHGLLGRSRQVPQEGIVAARRHRPQLGRVAASRGPDAHQVMQSLYVKLRKARQRAWIVTPYFVPSWKLRRLLARTARRGVDVRVLVPGRNTDHPGIRHASHRHYAQLLRRGVRIFEYQPRFMHAKLALCDNWVTIGSTNFDRWNLRWNLDANQEIADPHFTAQVVAMLERDFKDSEEIDYRRWLERSRWSRLYEKFMGALEHWLDGMHLRRR